MKRGGTVAVLAVAAPKLLVDKAVAAPPVVSAGPAATTLTVGDGSVFRVGDIIRNCSSAEAMMVTRIDGNTMSVVRGIGSQEPKPVRRGDDIMLVAGAVEQDSEWLDDRFLPRMSAGLQPVIVAAA